MPKDKDKDKKSTKSKDKDSKSTKSKDKDAKSSKSKDKDAKSTKSKDKDSKGKDKDSKSTKSKDKDAKSTKSKDKDKKSSKSGKSTPSKDKAALDEKKKASLSEMGGEKIGADLASQLDAEILSRGQTHDPNALGGAGMGVEAFGATATSVGAGPFGRFQNPHVTVAKMCMLHSKPLKFFCDTCEELLCYDCTVMGPHNTQLHRICNLDEAFRYRFEMINKSIHTSIVPKRA
jgi:hypothetical protein